MGREFRPAWVKTKSCLSDGRSSSGRKMLTDIFAKDAAQLEQERVRMSSFAVEDAELVDAVRKLFRDRCSFCESEVSVAPLRFALQQNLRIFVASLTGMRREPQFETANWQDHC